MQKVTRQLQKRLTVINKIQTNLVVKKFQTKRQESLEPRQFPSINQPSSVFISQQKNNQSIHPRIYNSVKCSEEPKPEKRNSVWMSIKKIQHSNKGSVSPFLQQNKAQPQSPTKILFLSSYANRFTNSNSPTKLLHKKGSDSNSRTAQNACQQFRKSYLDQNNIFFSPRKYKIIQKKDEIGVGSGSQYNSGNRFKTLDPFRLESIINERFKGKQQIRQANKARANHSRNKSLQDPPSNRSISQININKKPLSIPKTEEERILKVNTERVGRCHNLHQNQQNSSFQITKRKSYHNSSKRRRNEKLTQSKDRYSPWNEKEQQVYWDQLPKIKGIC